jgi:hypothetical protein
MRTSDTAFRHVSGWLPGTALALALLLTGCGDPGSPLPDNGSGTGGSATSGDQNESDDSNGSNGSNDSNDSKDSDEDDGSDGDDQETVEYEWGLPASDTSVGEAHQGVEGSAYIALASSCSGGAEFLSSDLAPTYGFESPRNVLLFAAGVRLCEGDQDGARELFGHSESYGTAGLTPDDWAFCVLHKVVRSVLEQRPPDEFQCGGGTAPPFKEGRSATGEILTDDPLTFTVDESAPEPEPEVVEPDPDPDGEVDGDQGTEGDTGTDPDGETGGEEGTDTETGGDSEPDTAPEP